MSERSLVVGEGDRRRLERWARAASPNECCGILVGRHRGEATVVSRLVPTANARRGDRRAGYRIEPDELVAAHAAARAGGEEIVGFYHSHPRGGPRPSPSDVEQAWPDVSYLIVALSGERCALAAWRRVGARSMLPEQLAPPGEQERAAWA